MIHLAIADLIVCSINMPLNAYTIFAKGWFAGKELCIFVAAFRYITIYAEWMIVSMIAVNKCVHLIRPKLGYKIFSGLSGHLIVASIWLIAISVFILEYYWVSISFVFQID